MPWEPCPRCKSNRVEPFGKALWFVFLFGSAGIFGLIGFFLPFMWIVSVLLILISPLSFLASKMLRCKDCNNAWKAPKEARTPAN